MIIRKYSHDDCKEIAELITIHASVTAKPFFEHRGYKMIRKQEVIRKGVGLINYIMEKRQ